jgi:Type II CAAX prenyl endopeptidase Rce1-like
LTAGAALLAILLYPGLAFFTPEPLVMQWRERGGLEAMPADLRERSARNGQYILVAKLGALFLIFALWTSRLVPEIIALPPAHPYGGLAGAAAAGLLMGVCRAALEPCLSRKAAASRAGPRYDGLFGDWLRRHPLLRGSPTLWIVVLAVSAPAEELWRAFCLRSLGALGRGATLSILVTSVAFAFAHLSGLPSRIRGTAGDIMVEVAVGAALGILFVACGSASMTCVANLCFGGVLFLTLRARLGGKKNRAR